MLQYSFEKKPAFFRGTNVEAFFEAEAQDTEIVLENLSADLSLDQELEELLEIAKK